MDDFEKIYRNSAPKVRRFLLGLTQDETLTEELLAETFYQALLHYDRFEGRSSIDTWLCQIAKNAFYKEKRRIRRLRSEDRITEEASADNIQLKWVDREEALEIHKALHRLPQPYQEVFSLHVLGELTFREIAEIFEKSESWAKMTYYRGKARLVQELEKD